MAKTNFFAYKKLPTAAERAAERMCYDDANTLLGFGLGAIMGIIGEQCHRSMRAYIALYEQGFRREDYHTLGCFIACMSDAEVKELIVDYLEGVNE